MPHQYKIRRAGITSRQMEVLYWLANGKLFTEIAVILNITPRTVGFHLYRAMERLDCVTDVQAVAVAIRMGLI
jgi:LuxR family transcriptional regulator, quorum-sensing system regulator CviR